MAGVATCGDGGAIAPDAVFVATSALENLVGVPAAAQTAQLGEERRATQPPRPLLPAATEPAPVEHCRPKAPTPEGHLHLR